MHGDYFEVLRREDGWHWRLRGSHHPQDTPIARCGRAYKSKRAAINSLESARRAMAGAFEEPRSPRIREC